MRHVRMCHSQIWQHFHRYFSNSNSTDRDRQIFLLFAKNALLFIVSQQRSSIHGRIHSVVKKPKTHAIPRGRAICDQSRIFGIFFFSNLLTPTWISVHAGASTIKAVDLSARAYPRRRMCRFYSQISAVVRDDQNLPTLAAYRSTPSD